MSSDEKASTITDSSVCSARRRPVLAELDERGLRREATPQQTVLNILGTRRPLRKYKRALKK